MKKVALTQSYKIIATKQKKNEEKPMCVKSMVFYMKNHSGNEIVKLFSSCKVCILFVTVRTISSETKTGARYR